MGAANCLILADLSLWLSSSTSSRNTNSGVAPSTEAFTLTIMADLWLRDVASSMRTDNLLEKRHNTVNYFILHLCCYVFHNFCGTVP